MKKKKVRSEKAFVFVFVFVLYMRTYLRRRRMSVSASLALAAGCGEHCNKCRHTFSKATNLKKHKTHVHPRGQYGREGFSSIC